jgi:hypothetical protein
VDCCAFLSYRLAAHGIQIRLRTQELDLAVPDKGDIYTLLKYLALVSPMHGRPAIPPDDVESFQIVLTARPTRLESIGWGLGDARASRVLDPKSLPR